MKTLLLWVGLISIALSAHAQTQVAKTITGTDGNFVGFLEFKPSDYGSQKHPLIIFLHGIGERGDGTTEIQNVTANGIANYCAHGAQMRFTVNGQTSSFVVLSPQLSKSFGAWPSWYVQDMINYAKANLQIDPNRIYVTGLSLGGGGVWTYAFESYANASQIAACAPVCGTDYGNDPNSCASAGAANLPIWAFHCMDDGTVGVGNLQHIQGVLNGCTSFTTAPRYTYYNWGGHSGAWTYAYDTGHITETVDSSQVLKGASTSVNFTARPNLYEWLLSHTLGATSSQPVVVVANQTIALPITTVTLNGSGSYVSSGSISSYLWTFVSGPTTPIIVTPTLASSVITTLAAAGVYTFQLTVTSSSGVKATSTVTVTVNGLTNQTPTSNAGSNATITLPTSSVALDGSASKDPDGTLTAYAWSQVSGPSTATFSSTNTATTTASGLAAGTYIFQLMVTDNAGATATSTVTITVNAASGGGTAGTGTGLEGDYYNSTDLSGSIVQSRTDATVNFNWTSAPVSGLAATNFSVRWTGQVQPQYSETYTFYTSADDGIRVWVNGQKLIDDWKIQGTTASSGTIALTAGVKYNIIVEYFQQAGGAVASLSWSSPSTPKAIIPQTQLYPPATASGGGGSGSTGTGTGLEGDYYNSIDLSGSIVQSRTDATVNFNWTSAPVTGLGATYFSVRWTGQVLPQYSETYTFYTTSDDGVRVWVNGQQLINDWKIQGPTETSGTIALTAGVKYTIVVEYYQNAGGAVATLSWSSPSTPKAIIPQSQLFPPATASGGGGSGSSTGTGLEGDYYNSTDLSGSIVQSRTDATVNFNWTSAPVSGLGATNFSVRWTGQVLPQYSETYTFYTSADDGIRVWVNGQKLIDDWKIQGTTTSSGTIALTAGVKYNIIVEYFQQAGGAVAGLSWSSPSTPMAIIPQSQLFPPSTTTVVTTTGTGLQGAYYNSTDLSGAVVQTRTDATVNFNWTSAPVSGLGATNFSVRWTGQVLPQYSETYTFYTAADDGIRVWVNGQLLVDDWKIQGTTYSSGTIALTAGVQYSIVVEYFQQAGGAVASLYWSSASTPKAIIPQSQLFLPATTAATAGRTGTVSTASASAQDLQPFLTVKNGIAPNPVTGGQSVRLNFNSLKSVQGSIQVINVNGSLVYSQQISLAPGLNVNSIATTGLAKGFYIVNVISDGKKESYKLIVQ